MLHSSTCNTADMYVYAQAVVVYLTGGHVPGYRRVPTYGGAIGYRGMVGYLVCYAVVPLTDCRMTSTAPTRDAVVGGMQLPSGPHRPGDHLGPTSGGSTGSQGMGDPVHYLQ